METPLNIIPIRKWFKQLSNKPVIISGPCSAETEKQLIETAKAINDIGKVQIFRAGIWKPRTRPVNFEGVGEKGLLWLKKAKEQTGLLTTVEVATPKHIEKCLKFGVDILWIGARTTSNPFSINELTQVLKGVDIPVMIKNPINPDINLWVGAIERFNKIGINKLAAIHRGFFPFELTSLRNIPKWEIPIELKRNFHNLSIICDPSHIAGKRKYINEISQKALDLDMDGLMIESHISPDKALTDSKQQITPKELKLMLDSLVIRTSNSDNFDFINSIEKYRDQIDSIDTQLIELLAQRMEIVKQIGVYKKNNDVTILQLSRWEKIINSRINFGLKLGLSEKLIKKIMQLIHKESIQKQNEIMNN
ncbi:MAG: bifunctional 3-deoxy-7-phosphoheptulonate synthase/chorismate mutase type II [Bacteroidetes bacterium]|nr:bifunctional 3-deoxy-7-phosphoheptulonate synthase/chorismate mutase type II [Bacteroidota bacterium]